MKSRAEYKDAYGQVATIRSKGQLFRLEVNEPGGQFHHRSEHVTFRAAENALRLHGYCWAEVHPAL